jgi:hypothetical protein
MGCDEEERHTHQEAVRRVVDPQGLYHDGWTQMPSTLYEDVKVRKSAEEGKKILKEDAETPVVSARWPGSILATGVWQQVITRLPTAI